MTRSTYTPQNRSLADRVCAYFLDNPSEELTAFEVMTMFDFSSASNVKINLTRAVDAQLLVIACNSMGEQVYGPGSKIDSLARAVPVPCAPAPAEQFGKHIPAKRGQQRPALDDYSTTYQPPVPAVAPPLAETVSPNQPPVSSTAEGVSPTAEAVSPTTEDVLPTDDISLDDFVIEDDVPLPPIHCAGGRTAKMHALLAKLKPGQSAQLSMRYHAVLAHSQAKAHKNKLGVFTMRTYPKTDMLRVWRVS